MQGWRTVVVNVLSLLIVVLGWDGLTQWVSPEVIASAIAVVNIILRYFTTTAIGVKP